MDLLPPVVACSRSITTPAEVARLLIEKGADPNATASHGVTPLIFAVQGDDARIAELLIERGADVERVVEFGATRATPMHMAVLFDRERIVRLLVEHGADDRRAFGDHANTASVALAAQHGNRRITAFLREVAAAGGSRRWARARRQQQRWARRAPLVRMLALSERQRATLGVAATQPTRRSRRRTRQQIVAELAGALRFLVAAPPELQKRVALFL